MGHGGEWLQEDPKMDNCCLEFGEEWEGTRVMTLGGSWAVDGR